jgi:hypothetical protein
MHFKISVKGAKPEEIAKGLVAAQAVFDQAGVTPYEAATARFNVEGWDVRGFKGPISDHDLQICGVWDAADQAAAKACCENWGPRRKPTSADLELVFPANDNGDCEDEACE